MGGHRFLRNHSNASLAWITWIESESGVTIEHAWNKCNVIKMVCFSMIILVYPHNT